jgi:glycosyltransferase involved in cell wall biosynthesis
MIKIFFDHQKFTTQKYGGISRYFATIINELKSNEEFDYLLGVLFSKNHYIQSEKQLLNNGLFRRFLLSEFMNATYRLNTLYCKKLLKKNDFDIFHPTYYDPYFIADLKKPMVTTVHDMTYERLPEYFWANDPLSYQKRLNIDRADAIIVISETTKNDLLELTGADEDKVKVIYHGIDLQTPLISQPVENLPEQYILFVGDRGGYKNFYMFIRAYAILREKYPDVKVVLTGGGSMGTGDLEFIKRLRLEDCVVHTQVSDEQLTYLYQHALVFIYPSLYEGFGLPILEAFKAQCPVLLSDTACFREIGSYAAVYFDTLYVDDLVTRMEELINSDQLRKELIGKGNRRILDFPVDKCTGSTLELYKSLI